MLGEDAISGKVIIILASVVIKDILEDPLQEHCEAFSAHPSQTLKHHFRHPFNAIRLFCAVNFPLNNR